MKEILEKMSAKCIQTIEIFKLHKQAIAAKYFSDEMADSKVL